MASSIFSPNDVESLREWIITTVVEYMVNVVIVLILGSVIIEMRSVSEVLGELGWGETRNHVILNGVKNLFFIYGEIAHSFFLPKWENFGFFIELIFKFLPLVEG